MTFLPRLLEGNPRDGLEMFWLEMVVQLCSTENYIVRFFSVEMFCVCWNLYLKMLFKSVLEDVVVRTNHP